MKKRKLSGKLTLSQIKGRIPIPKKGGAMKPKKGKGSYTRNLKHKGRSFNDCPFFLFILFFIV